MVTHKTFLLSLGLAVGACLSCAETAQPQLVVVVDTNAPVPGQLATHSELSAAAAVDALRVDIIGKNGALEDTREFAVPEAADWPLSFGIAPSKNSAIRNVRIRVRAFRAGIADTGQLNGKATLEPIPELSIDRVVDLAIPDQDVVTVRILLDADCIGSSPWLIEPARTCIAGGRLSAPPADAVEQISHDTLANSAVGTWWGSIDRPCRGPGQSGRQCVPGGFTVLGDPSAVGLGEGLVDPAPLRPVLVSPFWMDETEFTVGRFRTLAQAGQITGELPVFFETGLMASCTWRGVSDPSNDAYPLTCVSIATAEEACHLVGGVLPTEAQWEHAARGRGQGRTYPWGNTVADCFTASLSRTLDSTLAECPGQGPEPVGSHSDPATCESGVDVSRDGLLDLGGSVAEITADSLASYSAPCWAGPLLTDPYCHLETEMRHVARGGDWSSGRATAASTLRRAIGATNSGPVNGFRCAYEDEQ